MKAKLIYRNKVIGFYTITEFVIWELPEPTPDRPHRIKYRLYHGDKNGNCIVLYDNESGKGDHQHIGDEEIPYQFTNVRQLVADFLSDINALTKEHNDE